MRDKLEALMRIDLSQDDMYLLVRQLVKSLPFFGASQDEIRALRGLADRLGSRSRGLAGRTLNLHVN